MKKLALIAFALTLGSLLFGKVTLIETRNNTLMIDYELEPWKIVTDGDYSRIVTENMDYASTSGAPLLPYDEF